MWVYLGFLENHFSWIRWSSKNMLSMSLSETNYTLKVFYYLEWILIWLTTTTFRFLWRISYNLPKKALAHFPIPCVKIKENVIFFWKKKKIYFFWDGCWQSVKFLITPYILGPFHTKHRIKKIPIIQNDYW